MAFLLLHRAELTDGLHGDVQEAEAGAQRVDLRHVHAVGTPELGLGDGAGERVGRVLGAKSHIVGWRPASTIAGGERKQFSYAHRRVRIQAAGD